MVVISCDLDDTLIPSQRFYEIAKEDIARIIQTESDVSQDTIIEKLDEIDRKNYNEVGVTKTRFARSCEETARHFTSNLDIIDEAHQIGMSVIMCEDEYEKIGVYEGYDEFMSTVQNTSERVVLLTAGIKDIQKRKIDGTGIRSDFDSIHIVGSSGKINVLSDLSAEFEEVIHIGNSIKSDVKPAIESGATAIHIKNGDWHSVSERHNISSEENIEEVESLSEAADLIKHIQSSCQ